MNTWQPFVKLVRGMYCVSYLRFFCLLWLLARALPPLYSLSFSYYSKCSPLLTFWFLFRCNPNMTLTHLTRTIRTISGNRV